jgi:hypothetical protein
LAHWSHAEAQSLHACKHASCWSFMRGAKQISCSRRRSS